jgi:hypothetical protein
VHTNFDIWTEVRFAPAALADQALLQCGQQCVDLSGQSSNLFELLAELIEDFPLSMQSQS